MDTEETLTSRIASASPSQLSKLLRDLNRDVKRTGEGEPSGTPWSRRSDSSKDSDNSDSDRSPLGARRAGRTPWKLTPAGRTLTPVERLIYATSPSSAGTSNASKTPKPTPTPASRGSDMSADFTGSSEGRGGAESEAGTPSEAPSSAPSAATDASSPLNPSPHRTPSSTQRALEALLRPTPCSSAAPTTAQASRPPTGSSTLPKAPPSSGGPSSGGPSSGGPSSGGPSSGGPSSGGPSSQGDGGESDSDASDDSGITTYSPTKRLAWAPLPDVQDEVPSPPPPPPRSEFPSDENRPPSQAVAPERVEAYCGAAPSAGWVEGLMRQMERATHRPAAQFKSALPYQVAAALLDDATQLLKSKRNYGRGGTVVDIAAQAPAVVRVVGDTHGQFHDFLTLLGLGGLPGSERLYVFNGDFVDRGLWGLEILLSVVAWKLACPGAVTVLRGNHESEYCTRVYGFHAEVQAKYGEVAGTKLFAKCLQVFSLLPLAAVVNGSSLVVHGGLWRKPVAFHRKRRRKAAAAAAGESELELGSLDDLRGAMSGGKDPDGMGNSQLAADVLWSDPSPEPGLHENVERGIGLVFGPDVTEAFLKHNKLSLVIRSHEGPDARGKREGLAPMSRGFTEDHRGPHGRLVTVFSAPCYPMFVGEDDDQPCNDAAFVTLSPPCYAAPVPTHFAACPRPEAPGPYYDLYDEEEEEEEEEETQAAAGAAEPALLAERNVSDGDVEMAAKRRDHLMQPARDGDRSFS